MSKTWENGRNSPPHRRKFQTWNCRERGEEDGGYWDCGCGCESNFASRSKCRSCGVVRGRYQQQQGQSGRSCGGGGGREAPCPARTGCNRCPDDGNRPGCGPIGGGRSRAIAYCVGEPGCIHCSSNGSRGGRRGRVPDSPGQAGEAQAGPGSALGPQTDQGSERPTRLTRKQTRSTRRWSRKRSPSWLCSWTSRG